MKITATALFGTVLVNIKYENYYPLYHLYYFRDLSHPVFEIYYWKFSTMNILQAIKSYFKHEHKFEMPRWAYNQGVIWPEEERRIVEYECVCGEKEKHVVWRGKYTDLSTEEE